MRFFPILFSALFFGSLQPVHAQYWNDFELEPHSYRGCELQDPVSLFLKKVDSGEEFVDEANGKPLLKRLLNEFDIPVSSQVLVFTKTSLQRKVVSLKNPRALYFNEDVYLGWMPGGRVEIASIDPHVGPIFYFQRPLDRPDDLLFRRNRSWLGCHAGSATNFLPGLLGRSVFPRDDGSSFGTIRSFERVSHNVPFNGRWGGWLVTGAGLAEIPHMANAVADRDSGGRKLVRKTEGKAPTDLSVFFSNDAHLIEGSDILATLAHGHQITAHYQMNESQYKVRQALYDSGQDLDSGREALQQLVPADRADVEKSITNLIRYFTFSDEPSLGGKPVAGHGKYREDFHSNKRVSRSGKSLKDLDLKNHLLQHRLSWMIYSNAFRGLPRALKEEFHYRLWNILSDPGTDKDGISHLTKSEKAAIAEIVADTVDDLPAYWKVDPK